MQKFCLNIEISLVAAKGDHVTKKDNLIGDKTWLLFYNKDGMFCHQTFEYE